MMLKQLEMLGRGVRGFRKWARRTGKTKAEVERILEEGDNSTGGLAIGALKRSQDNKGMRLNVMKRAKREREKAEAAAAAAAAAHSTECAQAPGDTVENSRRKLRKQQNTEATGQESEFGDDGDDMPIDPNEPTYCLCNRISFGTMVGCDNEDCPKEWFHMECVGLTAEPPKTVKWYCPLCRDDPNPSRRDISQKTGRKKRKLGR
ncbi:hypothetical protein AA313_de0208302 [Arthrobotrys entomopaga]|nr:hypothetical protein AA313_de0208302 [Arthrobotrys entomopaga]